MVVLGWLMKTRVCVTLLSPVCVTRKRARVCVCDSTFACVDDPNTLEPCFFGSDLLPRLAISAFCALRAFVPPADAPNAALRGSAVAASAAVAAASSALPAGAADEYLNYNMTGGLEMGRNG